MTRYYGKGLSALVVDDEPGIQVVLSALLESAGFAVEAVGTLADARRMRADHSFDLVIVDKNLPDGNGLELARQCLEAHEDCEVMVMTAYANLESALAALRLKVADYLLKPFNNLAEVHDCVARVVEHLRLRRQNRQLLAELEEKNSRLEDLVVRDGLTGLYNHAYFQERLQSEIARSERGGHHLSLLFIDLDHFKAINDGVGHQRGDAILRAIAQMLRGGKPEQLPLFRLREHDLAVRYGGDEFVLMLPETQKTGAAVTAERLRRHVAAASLGMPGQAVTVSIGLATYPGDGRDRESLLRAADTALYAAKRLGRNRVVGYHEGLATEDSGVAGIPIPKERVAALDRSLVARAFSFVFQPIVSTDGRHVVGFEALARPQDPALGTVLETIAVAERTGKMVELGRMLRDLALGPVGELREDELLFVNLHPHELGDPRLMERGSRLQSLASRIVLEISESVAIKDYEMTSRVVNDLRALGFRVALDDLGAGYAGLHALAHIDADFVKLDISLVRNLHQDSRTSRLIKHILEYAGSEGITVVAEGVETEAEWDAVRTLGCPLVQGNFTGAPAPKLERPEAALLAPPKRVGHVAGAGVAR